jgi:hypothetical protein
VLAWAFLALLQKAIRSSVEVPPQKSGITWIHDNAMSPMRYLPEALGPGCAFLDYDNDGWVDLSGPSDFHTPPQQRGAL